MSPKLLTRATMVLALAVGAAPSASIFFAPSAYAQNAVTGALTGVVSDSTGAVVPGAQVTITDTATGATIKLTSNAEGRYTATLLKPSTYKVTATASGLASNAMQVSVLVGQTPSLDLTVTPNGSSQTVTVSAQTAQLTDTQSPAMITTLTEQQVQNLPAPGGDITTVAYTAPGVLINTNTSSGGYGNFNVNGLPGVSNLFVLNGADDMDPFLNLNNSGSSNMTLGLQEIAEAAVVVNGYSAQYGRQAGAIEEWTTKSGSNQFHGAATYYYSGTNLNANDYFNKQNGTPRPHERANQWGANIGGPIIKDKLFFFTDYEGDRYITPRTGVAAFPSAQLQQYTLNNLAATNPSALPYYQQLFGLYNASPNYARATAVTTGTGSLQDSTGNLGCGDLAGTPDGQGGTFGVTTACAVASEGQATNLNNEWLYTARVDWNVSAKQKLFGRFETDHGSQPTYTSFVSPQFNATSIQPSYDGQLNDTYSVTPNITNQFIFSADWYTAYFGPNNINASLAALPVYVALNNGGTNSGAWGQAGVSYYYPQGRNESMYQFVDDLTMVKGNHTLRFGYNFRRADISDYDAQANENGQYYVGSLTDFTNGNMASGNSYYSQAFPTKPTAYIALYNLGAYLQDEWQATPRLKLTFGARFDRNGNPLCNNNCFAIYNNGVFPQAGASLDSAYNAVMAANTAHPFNSIERVVFQPRFGFNYDVLGNGRTVIRGGAGIFEDNPAAIYVDSFFENFPEYYSANVTSGNITAPGVGGGAPANAAASSAVLQSGYTTGMTPNEAAAAVTAAGAAFTAPNVTVGPNTFRTPKYVEFNLQLQQQLTKADAVSLNYSGNVGYDELIYSQNANGGYSYGAGVPFGDLPATSPDPRFSSAQVIKNDAHSNYNGVTVSFRHIDTHGLTLNANYTYSHALDDVSNGGQPGTPANYDSIYTQIDPYNLRTLNYASADYDVRHSFNMDATYEEKFKSHNRYVNEAAAGWILSGKAYWRTGMPFSIINSALPTAIGGSTLGGSILAAALDPSTINRNCTSVTNPCVTAADFYGAPGSGQPLQTSFGNLPRNAFRGPRYADIDLTAAKHLVTWRTLDFQVGANAYNIANHTNFLQPSNDVATGAGTIYATAGPPTSPFGAAATGQGGRILQVFGKLNF